MDWNEMMRGLQTPRYVRNSGQERASQSLATDARRLKEAEEKRERRQHRNLANKR